MSSNKNTTQNPSGEKATTTGNSSSHHSLRKRHSPNNPSTKVGTSSTGTSHTNPEGANLEATASYSKLRKIVPPATSKDKESAKQANKPDHAAFSEQQSTKRTGSRELSALIQPFPDHAVISEERVTRSKAKALVEQQTGKDASSKRDNSGSSTKSSLNLQMVPPSSQPKSEEKSQLMASPILTATSNKSVVIQSSGQSMGSQRSSGFLSTLVPRMQHLLDTANSNSGSAAGNVRRLTESIADAASHFHYMGYHTHATTPAMLSIVEGLKSTNEIRQSEAAAELAEMLLLGNEESLPNMPIVDIVQALCDLLQKDTNFELMLTAARCITNMQEALPRALPVIAEAIPHLLSKLKCIEYIDVAEQSLIALEVMSRRSGKQILLQGGIASTIAHVDFFSLPSQRLCYQICANCALSVTHNEFSLVKDCLAVLTQRLVYIDDKRCMESICTFFNRIIENMRSQPDRLRQIIGGSYEFLMNVQKLLAVQPSNISPNTYLALLKSIRYISSQCPDAALALVRMDFGNTIRVLIGYEERPSTENESGNENSLTNENNEKTLLSGFNSRPAVQLKEIITLVGQIVENLPRSSEEVFSLLHLFPLLVEIGSVSSCSQLRNESLNVMMKMIKMVDKVDHLEPILRDIPLAVYITQMLSSNRNLGILLSSLQLSRALLDKLPRLYIPLFEAEGVFHEAARLTSPIESPVIDRKPQHPRQAIAEHLLKGLMNSTGADGAGVRVIIPPILLGQDSNSPSYQQNLQQLQDQVCKEAKNIIDKYAGENATKKFHIKEPHRAKRVYEKLSLLANKIRSEKDFGEEPLIELKNLLLEQEITSFQFNQSGIPSALVTYLTASSAHVHPQRKHRLKRFATVFMGLNADHLTVDSVGASERHLPFEKLVSKLLQTVGTVEQFQVRITNLSGIITSGSSYSLASYSALMGGSSSHASLFSTTLRGAQALRFFQTHQIRVNLRRHPKCKSLREWRHGRGSIKVDPFTSVSSIERYLLERGIGISGPGAQQQQNDDGDDDSDFSDEDQDLSFSSTLSNDGRVELYIGENLLPPEMSILQAIRQFALSNDDDTMETIPSSIWLAAHTIYYNNPSNTNSGDGLAVAVGDVVKAVTFSKNPASVIEESNAAEQQAVSHSHTPSSSLRTRSRLHHQKPATSKKERGGGAVGAGESSSSSAGNGRESQIYKTGKLPSRKSPLDVYLKLQDDSQLKDPSMNCLLLLNVLYGLNTYWWNLFDHPEAAPAAHTSLIPQSSFLSAKLNSKVGRQLSDFLTVATQQIPKWTNDLMSRFPFIFSFTTRRSFLFCTSFGRDRALMHLVSEANMDDGQEGAGHDATSRLIPRLERRKVSIKRDNVLKEAQQIFSQMNNSKAMLEVGFDGEVGTGFGPTLEFYSTLSRALQKYSLRIWDGDLQKCPETDRDGSNEDDYVYAANGLYPLMLSRQTSPKQTELRIKRFEFIGRLLGQSLLDSRMLDLPLAPAFFKWLVGEEDSLGMEDFEKLEPTVFRSLRSMAQTARDDFEHLDVTFTYPGEPSMELIKNGKNMLVTKDNCKQFIELVCFWRLIGGVRTEMEAVRRGFQLVINKESLRIFSSDEMELLFCGSADNDEKIWSKQALQHSIRPDHGYTYESEQIKWLIEMICECPREKRRRFLQFVTGSPRLPIGGFRGLNPPLTVVKKTASCLNNEEELPSAMTCYNYLKIPPYESYETFVARFNVALEHVYSFYLS